MSEDYTYPPLRGVAKEPEEISITFIVKVIERTKLQPGDLLVLTTPDSLPDKICNELAKQMRGLLPTGVQVVVLDCGLTIDGIISAQDGREL